MIVEQKQGNKLIPTFAAQPYCVTENIGNSVTIESPFVGVQGVQYFSCQENAQKEQ